MKKAIKFISLATIGLVIYIVIGASCLPKTSMPVQGLLFGRPFHTSVDNELAKLMLTNPSSDVVSKLFADYQDQPLNTNTLAEIAAKNSMDVATLYFMQRAYQDKQNKQAQDLYLTYLDQLSDNDFKQPLSPQTSSQTSPTPALPAHTPRAR